MWLMVFFTSTIVLMVVVCVFLLQETVNKLLQQFYREKQKTKCELVYMEDRGGE